MRPSKESNLSTFPGAIIETQNDVERYVSSETQVLNEARMDVSRMLEEHDTTELENRSNSEKLA